MNEILWQVYFEIYIPIKTQPVILNISMDSW